MEVNAWFERLGSQMASYLISPRRKLLGVSKVTGSGLKKYGVKTTWCQAIAILKSFTNTLF